MRSDRPHPGRRWLGLVAVGLALAGCDDGPRAPALRDEPEYSSSREGLRFLAGDNRPIKATELRDPWGQEWILRFGAPIVNQQIPFDLVSAGPDGELDTGDDLYLFGRYQLDRPCEEVVEALTELRQAATGR